MWGRDNSNNNNTEYERHSCSSPSRKEECCRHFKGRNKRRRHLCHGFVQGKKNPVDTLKVGIKEETFMSWFRSREEESSRHFKGRNKGGDIYVMVSFKG